MKTSHSPLNQIQSLQAKCCNTVFKTFFYVQCTFEKLFLPTGGVKMFRSYHLHDCDRSQNCLRLNKDFFLCDLSHTFLLLQRCMKECSVINRGKVWLFGFCRQSSGVCSMRRRVRIPTCLIKKKIFFFFISYLKGGCCPQIITKKCQKIPYSITMSMQHSVIKNGKRPTF